MLRKILGSKACTGYWKVKGGIIRLPEDRSRGQRTSGVEGVGVLVDTSIEFFHSVEQALSVCVVYRNTAEQN